MDFIATIGFISIGFLAFVVPFLRKPPMTKKYIIIRGLPGSGKSTLAAKMAAEANTDYTETDMFIYNEQGVYEWTPERHSNAIDMCHARVTEKFSKNEPVVIVTGVYTRWRSMRDYIEAAQAAGYEIKIIECKAQYQNIHDVPADTIANMTKKFIPNSGLPQMQGIKYESYP